jgi:hypothetical protein
VIHDMESGKRKGSVASFRRLAEALGVTIEDWRPQSAERATHGRCRIPAWGAISRQTLNRSVRNLGHQVGMTGDYLNIGYDETRCRRPRLLPVAQGADRNPEPLRELDLGG